MKAENYARVQELIKQLHKLQDERSCLINFPWHTDKAYVDLRHGSNTVSIPPNSVASASFVAQIHIAHLDQKIRSINKELESL